MVARSEDGPRGHSPLTIQQRDDYSNLILLCPTHHSVIDDFPVGPVEYPVERLLDIKRQHEIWVTSSDFFDSRRQLMDERWAGIADELAQRMGWDSWTRETSGIFSAESPSMLVVVNERLHATSEWIYSRIWPEGRESLRETILTMGSVLADFLVTFESRMMDSYRDGTVYATERFYKIDRWDTSLYNSLLKEYRDHTALVEDLVLELTRYGNLVADLVRKHIDPEYRLEQGALLIRRGPDIRFNYTTYRPEFTAEERALGQPYESPDQFRCDRITRELSASRSE